MVEPFVGFIGGDDALRPISRRADNSRGRKNNSRGLHYACRVAAGRQWAVHVCTHAQAHKGTKRRRARTNSYTRSTTTQRGGRLVGFFFFFASCVFWLSILGITRLVYYLTDKGLRKCRGICCEISLCFSNLELTSQPTPPTHPLPQ